MLSASIAPFCTSMKQGMATCKSCLGGVLYDDYLWD